MSTSINNTTEDCSAVSSSGVSESIITSTNFHNDGQQHPQSARLVNTEQRTSDGEYLEDFFPGHYSRVCNRSLPDESMRKGILGKGGFGEVFHARRIVDGKKLDYAIKKIDVHRVLPGDVNRQKREFELSSVAKIDSPYLIPIKEVLCDENHYYIVMQLVPGGHDLLKELKAEPPLKQGQRVPRFPVDKARDIFCKLVMGVMALHRNGVAHRDLKMKNILFDVTNNRPLICDFGMTNYFVEGAALFSDVGTIDFADPCVIMAPLSGQGYSAPLADIWSLGCVLHMMLTGYMPYPEGGALFRDSNGQLVVKTPTFLIEGHEAKSILVPYPEASCLLQSMLSPDPRHRITMNQILEHPWCRNKFNANDLSGIKTCAERTKLFQTVFGDPCQNQQQAEGLPNLKDVVAKERPPSSLLSSKEHVERIEAAVNHHLVTPEGTKTISIRFYCTVGRCKNVMFGTGGFFDKVETDATLRIERNRMMHWDKVDISKSGTTFSAVIETVPETEGTEEPALVKVRKSAGDNQIVYDLVCQLIKKFRGYAEVVPV